MDLSFYARKSKKLNARYNDHASYNAFVEECVREKQAYHARRGYPPFDNWRPMTVSEEEFNQKKSAAILQLKQNTRHPLRNNKIKLRTFPKLAVSTGFSNYDRDVDVSMFELVRNLSQVSTPFRQELGAVFWERVHVSQSDFLFDEKLLPVIRERPAVVGGIKQLYLQTEFTRHNYSRHAIGRVAAKLQLDQLYIDNSTLISACPKRNCWVLFRTLRLP